MVTATATPTPKLSVVPKLQLLTGGDPEGEFLAPAEETFNDEQGDSVDYRDAPDLARIGKALMREYSELGFLQYRKVTFLWKKKGGGSAGIPTLGRLAKTPSLLKHFQPGDYVVWVAADHVEKAGMTNLQVEALVYSLLCYATTSDKGAPTVARPDFVGFATEVRRYGAWRPQHKVLEDAFQARLFPAGDATP